MMQMNIERMINATGSLLIWLVMILAAAILAGLIIIAAKAISQGIKDMDRKGERKDADNNTSKMCAFSSEYIILFFLQFIFL